MMNPGIAEETATTARSAIDALKSTPIVLSIVIFNVLFILLTGWLSYNSGERLERLMVLALKSCPADAIK